MLEAIRNHLFPVATVITPNLEEARVLTGLNITDMESMETAAHDLLASGAGAVLLKGGKFDGTSVHDILVDASGTQLFTHQAYPGRFHGTGCALSSAIAAGLAFEKSLPEAVQDAVAYVQSCLENSLAPVKGRLALLGHSPRYQ